ncbi:unnamed protein product [Lactuca saligna]|uniref:Uncharacterized protein n=1 Tax=Lactuca saligna TaxID=75948 RepID=A0AA35ZDJ0_LACSI|nr:unnamed protein product [Lactuca saligna]
MTPKAFKFHSFVIVANVPSTDKGADHLLFSFYLKHMKPQYKTLSASKIIVVEVIGPIKIDNFPKAKFKVVREVRAHYRSPQADDCFVYSTGGKMDMEIANVLQRNPSVLPKEVSEGFEKLKLGKIYKEGLYVVLKAREGNDADFHKACFFLPKKHLYTTSF